MPINIEAMVTTFGVILHFRNKHAQANPAGRKKHKSIFSSVSKDLIDFLYSFLIFSNIVRLCQCGILNFPMSCKITESRYFLKNFSVYASTSLERKHMKFSRHTCRKKPAYIRNSSALRNAKAQKLSGLCQDGQL